MKNHKSIIVGLVVLILIIAGFFFWPRKNVAPIAVVVPCLDPNIPTLKQHIHPHLQIIVEGQNEVIPANIGLSSDCEKSVHTHDTSGIIHVEAQDNRQYTLGDFFTVWFASGGKKINRFGYKIEITVDGNPFGVAQGKPEDVKLKDKQEITLKYSK